MTIVIKPSAWADFKAIRAWGEANWGHARSRDHLTGLKLALQHLERNPLAGRGREAFAAGLRSWNHAPHVIFYVLRDSGIGIVRVVHERRNHAALDFSEGIEGDL